MATRDPIVAALASVGGGAAIGASVITLGLIVLRTVQRGDSHAGNPDLQFAIIGTSLFAGVVAAVASGWRLAWAIDDTWRRAVAAALTVFGATMLAAVAAPVDVIAGRVGLAGYVVVLVAGATLAVVQARRASVA